MKELTVEANVKHLDEILAFIDEIIAPYPCDPTIKFQLELSLEEIYVNIAYYAYPNDIGTTTIRSNVHQVENKPPLLVMEIHDQGTPYNPLEHEGPDIGLTAEEREIGGLGIFIVKNSMDNLSYRYQDNNNIFTVEKYLA